MIRAAIPPMLLLAALLLGGSAAEPTMELAVQLVFAAGIIALAFDSWRNGTALVFPRAAWLLAGLVLVLPLAQLVPLPAALWQALPGRGVEAEALALINAGNDWMPWSMTPTRTRAALLAMLAATGLFLLATRLDLAGRRRMLLLIVLTGIATGALGALQISAGDSGAWRLQSETHLLFVTGFFANRNATADFLLIALMALAAWWATAPARFATGPLVLSAASAILLVLTLLLTGSRMGILLLGVAALFVALIILPSRRGRLAAPALAVGAMLAAVMLATIAALQLPALRPVLTRLLNEGDQRWKIWEDTRYAIEQVWPAGSGIGSFRPIFIAHEQLEFVSPAMPMRAHNDWLEFTLEAGIAGWIVLAAIALVVAKLGWQRLIAARGGEEAAPDRALALFAIGSLSVIALHSLVDYPLRTMALACLSGFAMAMLFTIPENGPVDQVEGG